MAIFNRSIIKVSLQINADYKWSYLLRKENINDEDIKNTSLFVLFSIYL